jgi:hypothetical protein
MGIYTSNRYFGGNTPDYAASIPANEAYNAAFGCAHIMADCQANDMALFEAAIYSDIQEVMSIQEGYQVVNENAFTNVIDNIRKMFEKLVAKIKGIFKAFIAKLDAFSKSGVDLVKKYDKQIMECKNWKKFKLKGIRKPKDAGTDLKIDTAFSTSGQSIAIGGDRYKIAQNGEYNPNIDNLDSAEAVKNCDASELKDKLTKMYCNKADEFKNLAEELEKACWDEATDIDGEDDKISYEFFSAAWIKGVLNNKKLIENAEKFSNNLNKAMNDIIDDLKKTGEKLSDAYTKDAGARAVLSADKNFSRTVGTDYKTKKSALDFNAGEKEGDWGTTDKSADSDYEDNGKDGAEKRWRKKGTGVEVSELQKIVQAMQKIATNEQEVVTKFSSEYLAQTKFAMAQAKKIYSAAASYSSTEHKESYEYYNALGECAAEQVYQNFEAIC